MKKVPASFTRSSDLPRLTKALPNDFFLNQRKTKQAEIVSQSIARPNEELINYLNRIGHEYPFCVNNKHKMNDPL